MPTIRVPSLCRQKSTGRYYVTDPRVRKEVYFGRDRAAAEAAYERWRLDYLRQQQETPGLVQQPTQGLSVAELCRSYLQFADGYYRKGGRRTSEYLTISRAVDALVAAAADVEAAAFDQDNLKAARQVMAGWDWERNHANKQVGRIRRLFRWAAEHKLIPVSVVAALDTVAPLKKGRCGLREEVPVLPVAWEVVEATLPYLRRPSVRDLVQVHFWSGMRPEEAVCLAGEYLDRSAEPWKYTPPVEGQKLDHLDQLRVIALGPRARAILLPLLRIRPRGWLFLSRGRGPHAHKHGHHLTVNGYRQAIRAACLAAGVPHWSPLQLRHSTLTAIRAAHGLDAAQAVGGHSRVETTQVYATIQWDKAARVAEEMG